MSRACAEPIAETALGGGAQFDHAAHAARRIRDLMPLYGELLGGRLLYGGDNPRVGYRGIVLAYANGHKVELLEPLPGSRFLDSFFARNPLGGLHHLTFRVEDIAGAVAHAQAHGLDVVGANDDDPNWREAFVHPRSGHGALIQLVQAPHDHPRHDPAVTLEALLGESRTATG